MVLLRLEMKRLAAITAKSSQKENQFGCPTLHRDRHLCIGVLDQCFVHFSPMARVWDPLEL